MNLICFPYAGGSSLIYKDWNKYLNNNVNLISYELSGRGRRMSEPLYDNQETAIDQIYEDIKNDLDKAPYSMFGHSMGTTIVFLLFNKIIENGHSLPEHLFFSGSRPPHLNDIDKDIHLLSEDKFIEKIKEYGATPDGFFENKDLLNIFLPILRHDLKLAQLEWKKEYNKQNTIDISIFYGDQEGITKSEIEEWKNYTDGNVNIHSIPGDHFFINENKMVVLDLINKKI